MNHDCSWLHHNKLTSSVPPFLAKTRILMQLRTNSSMVQHSPRSRTYTCLCIAVGRRSTQSVHWTCRLSLLLISIPKYGDRGQLTVRREVILYLLAHIVPVQIMTPIVWLVYKSSWAGNSFLSYCGGGKSIAIDLVSTGNCKGCNQLLLRDWRGRSVHCGVFCPRSLLSPFSGQPPCAVYLL